MDLLNDITKNKQEQRNFFNQNANNKNNLANTGSTPPNALSMYNQSDRPANNLGKNDNINKNNYNANIQPFLKAQANAKDISTQQDVQNIMQRNIPNSQQIRQMEESGGIVNNIINPNNSSLPKENNNGNQYTGSQALDLIRDVYKNTNNVSLQMAQYEQEFIANCNKIVLDAKYNEKIKKSEAEKGKFKPIKAFKGWSGQLALPMIRLLENTNEKGEMSIGDYEDLINGPLANLKKDLQADLNKPTNPIEMKNFIKKALEQIADIENNNGFSFNPTDLRYKFGIIHRNLSDVYNNISVFDQIIMALFNFFTFTDFFQENKEARNIIDSLDEDIKCYYQTPVENRQFLINKINEKMARIEYVLSNASYLVSTETLQNFKAIKEDLSNAMKTSINSSSFIVGMIKTFGQDAINGIDISTINKSTLDAVKKQLASSIKNDSGCSEAQSNKYADALLSKTSKDDISCKASEEKYIYAYFDGKVKSEFDFMMKKMNDVFVFEDTKIKGNLNLQKADAISKTSKAIIDAICVYVGKCNEEIENIKRKYAIFNTTGVNISEDSINNDIKRIKTNMLIGIKNITTNAKENIFEYIDNEAVRNKVIKDSEQQFKDEKESIKKVMNDQLLKKGQPQPGKEADVLEINDILINMKNIPEFSFKNWESIDRIVSSLEQQINTDREFKISPSDNNLFKLASQKANIENKMINEFLKNGWVNSQRTPMMRQF